ncbi:MAG: cytochrome P450, partial [Actinomycetales bacterium]
NGGTGATINALGNGLALLLADEGLRDAVIAERAWERAVEEFLRYEAPLQLFERQVVKDAEDLGLAGVRDGDRVGLLLGAANRDPSRYAEPHRFDPLRPVQPHLSFSAGTHFCLGAPLARMELQRIVEELLTALPGLRLAAAPVPERTYVVRGHQRIDVSDRIP